MKSLLLPIFAVLVVCSLFASSNADTKLFRVRRAVDLPPDDSSLTQKIQRELQSLQHELQATLPRNGTINPLATGDSNGGLSSVFNFILQTILILPKGFLTVGITFTEVANRLLGGLLNGLNEIFRNLLNFLNTL